MCGSRRAALAGYRKPVRSYSAKSSLTSRALTRTPYALSTSDRKGRALTVSRSRAADDDIDILGADGCRAGSHTDNHANNASQLASANAKGAFKTELASKR